MARNGSGQYELPESDFVNGTVIDETVMNSQLSDIEAALTASLAANGETTATGNLKMGSNKLTGLAAGSAATDSATLGQIQAGAFLWAGTGGGTADVITASVSPAISAYAAGQRFVFIASGNNTGAVTININSVGAKAITKNGTTALAADDLVSGKIYTIVYDGTRFQIEDLGKILNTNISPSAAIDTTKLGAGALVQMQSVAYTAVATGTTVMSFDDVVPANTEGDERMTLAITPKDADNKLIVMAWAMASNDQSATFISMALYQDSSAGLAVDTYTTSAANEPGNLNLSYTVTAGGTSAITYKVRIGSSAGGTTTFNGSSSARRHGATSKSGMIIMEVAG